MTKTIGLIAIFYMLGCFILTVVTYALNIIFLPQLPISQYGYTAILAVSLLFIVMLPLAPSSKRPIISHRKYALNKVVSWLLCVFGVIVLWKGMHDLYLIHCGIWAFSIQAVQQSHGLPETATTTHGIFLQSDVLGTAHIPFPHRIDCCKL